MNDGIQDIIQAMMGKIFEIRSIAELKGVPYKTSEFQNIPELFAPVRSVSMALSNRVLSDMTKLSDEEVAQRLPQIAALYGFYAGILALECWTINWSAMRNQGVADTILSLYREEKKFVDLAKTIDYFSDHTDNKVKEISKLLASKMTVCDTHSQRFRDEVQVLIGAFYMFGIQFGMPNRGCP